MHAYPLLEWLILGWRHVQDFILVYALVPLLASTRLIGVVQDPRDVVNFMMINGVQIAIIAAVFRPLESLVPLERWPDRKMPNLDRFYTLLKGFGLVPIFTFLIIEPISTRVFGASAAEDAPRLAQFIPWFGGHPWLLFLLYFALLDLVAYGVHILQHRLPWWWAMHSLHHSQRQMSCWTNDRSHVLDDGIEALITALVGVVLGVPSGQYAVLILIGALIENFSHANVRVRFGPVLDKLLVDPRFHRVHHILASAEEPHLHDCNYALVLPIWDILFGTARYDIVATRTGVNDPVIDADNGKGWLGQQMAGFVRLGRALDRRRVAKSRP